MLDITKKAIADLVNQKRFRKITIMKPVDYYDHVGVDRDTHEFYVTETAWDIIKNRWLDRYEAYGYSRTWEINEDNIVIFVDLEKQKDDDKVKKK